jgi:hypothetical protein
MLLATTEFEDQKNHNHIREIKGKAEQRRCASPVPSCRSALGPVPR